MKWTILPLWDQLYYFYVFYVQKNLPEIELCDIKKRHQGCGHNAAFCPVVNVLHGTEALLKALDGDSEHIYKIPVSAADFPFVFRPVTKGIVTECERIENHFNYLKKLNHLSLSVIHFHVFSYLLPCAFKACHDRCCLLLYVCRIWRIMGNYLGGTHDILLN